MIAAAVLEAVIGVRAEHKELEEIAAPLSSAKGQRPAEYTPCDGTQGRRREYQSRLTWAKYLQSFGRSSSAKIALTGHTGTQAAQQMQSSDM